MCVCVSVCVCVCVYLGGGGGGGGGGGRQSVLSRTRAESVFIKRHCILSVHCTHTVVRMAIRLRYEQQHENTNDNNKVYVSTGVPSFDATRNAVVKKLINVAPPPPPPPF